MKYTLQTTKLRHRFVVVIMIFHGCNETESYTVLSERSRQNTEIDVSKGRVLDARNLLSKTLFCDSYTCNISHSYGYSYFVVGEKLGQVTWYNRN